MWATKKVGKIWQLLTCRCCSMIYKRGHCPDIPHRSSPRPVAASRVALRIILPIGKCGCILLTMVIEVVGNFAGITIRCDHMPMSGSTRESAFLYVFYGDTAYILSVNQKNRRVLLARELMTQPQRKETIVRSTRNKMLLHT